jgi:hypothetical protein
VVKDILHKGKGYHFELVHSDKMVLMIARWENGPCELRPNSRTTSSGEAHMRVGTQL